MQVDTHTLSWMNLLILLLVYFSSLYFTLLSSNLFLSVGGRNRTIPLQVEHNEVRREDMLINTCCTEISSLRSHVLALQENLSVCVSEAVFVPQRAGSL